CVPGPATIGSVVTAPYHLFEVAWEAGDQPSRALPFLVDRARATVERFGDRYVLVGPAVHGLTDGGGAFEAEAGHEGFEEGCHDAGIPVRVGRWRVEGRPRTILVDFAALSARKDAVLSRLWRMHRVDSLFAGRDYVQAVLFG